MSYVAAGVAVAGAATSAYGSITAGNAASKAAKAQQYAAARAMEYVKGQQGDALDKVLTPSALAAHDQALSAQEGNVRRQETLAQNIDPGLIEAGKQTAQLLQGKSAPVLQNIQNQRSLQRTQMLDNLKQQLGPGAETSSAGQQAMQKFDNDTANMMSGVQQQYLQQVSGIALNGAQTLGESLNRVNANLDQMSTSGPEDTAAKLIAQFTGAGEQAQQGMVNAAGGEFKGQQLQGQMLGQLGGAAMQGAAFSMGNRAMSPSPTGAVDPSKALTSGEEAANEQASGLGPGSFAASRAQGMPAVAQTAAVPGTLGASMAPPIGRSAGAGIPANANYQGAPNSNFGTGFQDPRFKAFSMVGGGQ